MLRDPVEVGQRMFRVGAESERHAVPSDVHVGVVVGRLGGEGHSIDESHRLVEVGEHRGSGNRVTVDRQLGIIEEDLAALPQTRPRRSPLDHQTAEDVGPIDELKRWARTPPAWRR